MRCTPDCLVIETAVDYACHNKVKAREAGEKRGPGFGFPRVLCKRNLTREDVKQFIEQKETAVISDFVSKKGRKFSAKLVMENDWTGFRFEFPPRVSKAKANAAAEAEALAAADGVAETAAVSESAPAPVESGT